MAFHLNQMSIKAYVSSSFFVILCFCLSYGQFIPITAPISGITHIPYQHCIHTQNNASPSYSNRSAVSPQCSPTTHPYTNRCPSIHHLCDNHHFRRHRARGHKHSRRCAYPRIAPPWPFRQRNRRHTGLCGWRRCIGPHHRFLLRWEQKDCHRK